MLTDLLSRITPDEHLSLAINLFSIVVCGVMFTIWRRQLTRTSWQFLTAALLFIAFSLAMILYS